VATFTVVVPVKAEAKKPSNFNFNAATPVDETSIPFLGQSTRMVFTEDELRAWFDMFLADNSMGSMFYVERHGR
jgi:hypothetical protein